MSQAQKSQDVVFLNNGSVIRGEIIDSSEMKIKIQSSSGNIWSFSHKEIDRISDEKVSFQELQIKAKSYFNVTDFGVLAGSSNNEKSNPFSLQMINGYYLYKNLPLGLGVGIEFYNEPVIPLFLDSKILLHIKNSLSIPFFYIRGGYSLPLEDKEEEYDNLFDSKGGPMGGLGIGTIITINERNGIVISLGYRFQQLKHIRSNDWTNEEVDRYEKYNRLAIKVGLYIN